MLIKISVARGKEGIGQTDCVFWAGGKACSFSLRSNLFSFWLIETEMHLFSYAWFSRFCQTFCTRSSINTDYHFQMRPCTLSLPTKSSMVFQSVGQITLLKHADSTILRWEKTRTNGSRRGYTVYTICQFDKITSVKCITCKRQGYYNAVPWHLHWLHKYPKLIS